MYSNAKSSDGSTWAPSFDECPSILMHVPETVCNQKRQKGSRGSGKRAVTHRHIGGPVHDASAKAHGPRLNTAVYCTSSLRLSDPTPVPVDHLTLSSATLPRPLSLHTASERLPATACVSKQPSSTYPARSILFHPHTNRTDAEDEPRAALRLLMCLINAIRGCGGSDGHHVTMNHYVERVDVLEHEGVLSLTVDVTRLFDHSPLAGTSSTSSSPYLHDPELQRALRVLRCTRGTTVDIRIAPILSYQRRTDEFIEHFTDGIYGDGLGSCLHYFGELPASQGLNHRRLTDIVCGFVVPDLMNVAHLLPDRDALPFEPIFFDKLSCMFQFFIGDATNKFRSCPGRIADYCIKDIQCKKDTHVLIESDVLQAYASALHMRPSIHRSSELPHAQWYQPFSVRLPHHLATVESIATVPVSVGSTVSSLEHGLRPVSLSLASDLLDRAIILAVLRLAKE